MPNIPTYDAQVTPQIPRASGQQYISTDTNVPVDNAVNSLLNSAGQFVQQMEKIKDQDERIAARKDFIEYQTRVSERANTDVADEQGNIVSRGWLNRTGEEAKSVVDEFQKFSEADIKQITRKGYSKAVMADLLDDIALSNLKTKERLTEHIIKEREADQQSAINETALAQSKLVFADSTPSMLDLALVQQFKTIDLTSFPDREKERMKAEAGALIVDSYLKGNEEDGSPYLEAALQDKNIRELLPTAKLKEWDDRLVRIQEAEQKDSELFDLKAKKAQEDADKARLNAVRVEIDDKFHQGELTERDLLKHSDILKLNPALNDHAQLRLKAQKDMLLKGKKSIYEVTNKALEADMWKLVYKDPEVFLNSERADYIDLWSFNTKEAHDKGQSIGFDDVKALIDKAKTVSTDKAIVKNTPVDSVLDELDTYTETEVFWPESKWYEWGDREKPETVTEISEMNTKINSIREKIYNAAKARPNATYMELKAILDGEMQPILKGTVKKVLDNATGQSETRRTITKEEAIAELEKKKLPVQYTQDDLDFTAKKHGISVDEVKKRLGIKDAD